MITCHTVCCIKLKHAQNLYKICLKTMQTSIQKVHISCIYQPYIEPSKKKTPLHKLRSSSYTTVVGPQFTVQGAANWLCHRPWSFRGTRCVEPQGQDEGQQAHQRGARSESPAGEGVISWGVQGLGSFKTWMKVLHVLHTLSYYCVRQSEHIMLFSH